MKVTFFLLSLIITFLVRSQSCDLVYLPQTKNLVVNYNLTHLPIGMYIGGNMNTLTPTPFFYYSPVSYLNRIGISISSNKVDFMFGGFVETFRDSINIHPDFWVKVYPLRIITNTKNGFDFVLALNYMKKTNYGVGISIPFGNIYSRL